MDTPNQKHQDSIGNRLNNICWKSRIDLFNQAEGAEITYSAYKFQADNIKQSDEENITVTFPVRYTPSRETIDSTHTYTKENFLARIEELGHVQLATNSLMQILTITEAALGDIVIEIIKAFPKKAGGKRSLTVSQILETTSLEELHTRIASAFLNDLSYKSPADFAKEIENIISMNLLECPAYHWYIEAKATRDVYVHNRGYSNDVYFNKAGAHSRVQQSGEKLPVDLRYFLEVYEHCLQLIEWIEANLHEKWHSSLYEEYQRKKQEESENKNQE